MGVEPGGSLGLPKLSPDLRATVVRVIRELGAHGSPITPCSDQPE